MSTAEKISDTFDLVFSDGEPHRRRSALVFFDGELPESAVGTRHQDTARPRAQQLEAAREANRSHFQSIISGYLKEKPVTRLDGSFPVRYRMAGAGALPAATVEVTAATVRALAKQPNVVAILPNQNVHLIAPTKILDVPISDAEMRHNLTWGLQKLQIHDLWEQAGTRGEGIRVGILDTGVYGEHSTLKGKVHAFTIIDPVGRQLSLTKGETFDYDRHGTHVCGTIAGGESSDGNAIGVAPDAKLVVAQVHFGQRAFLSSVVDGIGWAITQGASVINMSIGTNYYEEKFDVLFKWLVERDIAPVVSIGNNSHGSTHSPGNASYALGVGAVQKSNGAVEVAPFSGGGSLDFPGNPLSRIIKPDVVAPGAEVWSCVPSLEPDVDEYRYMDGTSMAAPHAAGVVAVLMAACPKKSVLEIFQAIKETANHPRGKNLRPDNRWGYGMIDPLAALDALRQS